MELLNFLRMARKYSAMGSSVHDQIDDVLNGENMEDLNSNALAWIRDLLVELEKVGVEDNLDLQGDINSYLDKNEINRAFRSA